MVRKSLPIVALILGLLLVVGVTAYTTPNATETPTSKDATVSDNGYAATPKAGDRNTLLQDITLTDKASADLYPLDIEYVCVQKTAASTLPDQYIYQLKLILDNGNDTYDGPPTDRVIGIIRRPDFESDDGACFGRSGRLLFDIDTPSNTQTPSSSVSQRVYIAADLRFDAPDLLTFQPVTTFVASSRLLGGATESSGFISSGEKTTAVGGIIEINNATGALDVQITAEPNDFEAEPGAHGVVLGQFLIEDFAGDQYNAFLEHVTLFLQGFRGGSPSICGPPGTGTCNVLDSIQALYLYAESGGTKPGYQRGDRLLARLSRPSYSGELVDLNGDGTKESLEVVLGRRGRPFLWIPNGAAELIYVVADLGPGFQDGDQIGLKVIAGTRDRRGGTVSSRMDLTPGMPAPAYNLVNIAAPVPTLVINDATIQSFGTGRVTVSMKNFPAPGLESLYVTFLYDPSVVDYVKVRSLSTRYEVLYEDATVPGELVVLLGLKGVYINKPMTGDFDLLEIEFKSLVEEGSSEVRADLSTLEADDINGGAIPLDASRGMIEVGFLKGDVDGDGVVTRLDAREVALFIIGRSTLGTPPGAWTKAMQKAADVVAPFCTAYIDLAERAPVCIDASDVRAIMLAAYGLITLDKISALAAQPLQVDAITLSQSNDGFALAVNGRGVASTQVQVYNLAGDLVFDREAAGNALQFQALDSSGQALANGVYLYVVTVKGWDGTAIKSKVRKLVVLR